MKTKPYDQQLAAWAKRRAKMEAMHKAGASFADIGRVFQISRQRVRQMLEEKAESR